MLLVAIMLPSDNDINVSEYNIHDPVNGKFHAIVRLHHSEGGTCSGFVFSDTMIMTAGHCMDITENDLDEDEKEFVKPDKFKIFDISGVDTEVVGTADWKANEKRDYGFITGDFKKFNKLYIKQGFDTKVGDMLRACGFPGGTSPAICIDFEARGSFNFDYYGYSMFVGGISGGPVIDHTGQVVGIAKGAQGEYSVMTPMIGVVNFE